MVEYGYAYNPLNQLTKFEDAEGNVTTYAYDGTGMRVSKTQGTNVQRFYWDRGYIVNESTNGAFTASNSVGNGEFQDYSYNTMFLTTFNSSVVLQNKIDEKLAEFKKSGLSTNTITGDDLALYGKSNLNDYDLSFAVGKANYTMTFNKVEKNKSFLFWDWKETNYNVTVTITDIYNFDEYRDSKSIGAILNNWGYDKQKAGQIKPFEWKITFTVKGLE